jgi:hypothetical protein
MESKPCCHCNLTSIVNEGKPGTIEWSQTARCKCGAKILKYITGAPEVGFKFVTIIIQNDAIVDRKEQAFG